MITDDEVYDGDTVDHSSRSRALQAIFRRIEGWLDHFDLGRTCNKNSHAFYLPGARQVTSPLATVQYMDTKGAPYVEFRFYRGALAELDVLDEFEARWQKVEAWAEAPDFTFDVTRTGEYKMAFSGDAMADVERVLKLLEPLMMETVKRKPRVL
jgi:hypothetical protein